MHIIQLHYKPDFFQKQCNEITISVSTSARCKIKNLVLEKLIKSTEHVRTYQNSRQRELTYVCVLNLHN